MNTSFEKRFNSIYLSSSLEQAEINLEIQKIIDYKMSQPFNFINKCQPILVQGLWRDFWNK